MAFTIPETLPSRGGIATPGERKLFVALRDRLPEDYLVYYDIPVQSRHPDFIVVGPDLGVIVLEVKDWRLDSVATFTADGVRLRTKDGEVTVKNPAQQVREYVLILVDLLKRRPRLRQGPQLRFRWGYGLVFPFLTGQDIRTPSLFGPSLEEALGAGFVLTGDDLAGPKLLPALQRLLPPWTPLAPLTPDEVDEIRGTLHPEIRIGWGHSDQEILEAMDREQERLARTLGDGHRLLRGVAGSGKTITLTCRARHLQKQHPDWRILVLCFNRVLASFLQRAIDQTPQLEVRTFHSWCRSQLNAAGVEVPEPPGRGRQWEEYWDEMPRLLLQAYDEGRARASVYQAILVDEGQDFADDWYRALLRALDPETDSLFIALDSSQNIYKRKLSWRAIGVNAAGRTRVLRVNYRNTRHILSAAYRMIQALDSAASVGEEPHRDEYVVPDRAVRSGPPPEVRRHHSFEAERTHVLKWVRDRLAHGIAAEQILLLGLSRLDMTALAAWLRESDVPATLLGEIANSDEGVRLSTIHSAKGLDADHVLLIAAHRLQQRDDAEARRLLYIAMTRAKTEICVSYVQDSPLMAELTRACLLSPGQGEVRSSVG